MLTFLLSHRPLPSDAQDSSAPTEAAQSNGGSPDPAKKKDDEVLQVTQAAGNGDQPPRREGRNRWDNTETVVYVVIFFCDALFLKTIFRLVSDYMNDDTKLLLLFKMKF